MAGKTITIEINSHYGYVILVLVGVYFLNIWLSINVGRARKRFSVKPPAMYSDTNVTFNCIQRAHQNFLEFVPFFIPVLLVAGIPFPRFAAAAGALTLLGRIVYTLGYYTGDPAKRSRGAFAYLGYLPMMFLNLYFGLSVLGCF